MSKSSCDILPAGPVPVTCERSTPASLALRLTAGDARGLAPVDATVGGGVGAAGLGAGSVLGSGLGSGAAGSGCGSGSGSGSG